MIELLMLVRDADGQERELRDWLVDSGLGAAKLRSAVVAVDALDRYEQGQIEAKDFAGRDVLIRVGIEKRRGFPDQNRIEDYRAASASSVVNLRAPG